MFVTLKKFKNLIYFSIVNLAKYFGSYESNYFIQDSLSNIYVYNQIFLD